uniref:Histidinol-phosphatase n=1 Tax=Chlorobium chlorochromatii (strain CaD3) TaxID=340177 RepID=Q3AQE8_CHLCH
MKNPFDNPHRLFAFTLINQASQIALTYYGNQSLKVDTKRDASPVTIADRKAEAFIRKELELHYPDDGILGEEFGEKLSQNGRRWVIDPIDGTKAFIHHVPLWGMMLALEVNGEPHLGIIAFPALGTIYHAVQGEGAYEKETPISVSSVTSVADATIVFTEKEYLLDSPSNHPVDMLRNSGGLVRGWGDCYGHMLVASGNAEVAVDKIVSPWDCAAVIPIVTEAGGCCFDYKGNKSSSGEYGLVSTNRQLGEQLLQEIAGKG